jgi:hypothetical protein
MVAASGRSRIDPRDMVGYQRLGTMEGVYTSHSGWCEVLFGVGYPPSTRVSTKLVFRLRNDVLLMLVHQSCSNPSKYPETLRKASWTKCLYLQAFCKLQKPPANYRTAFTRQRSLVRTQHRPLVQSAVLQEARRAPLDAVRLPLPTLTITSKVNSVLWSINQFR